MISFGWRSFGWRSSLIAIITLGTLFLGEPHTVWTQETEPTVAKEIHTVQVGESLSVIAQTYGITLEELMARNGINNPDAIYVGQVLQLPPENERAPTPTPLPVHEVQPGETLSSIALQYDLTVEELMAANGLRNADEVIIGQQLRIPSATLDPTTTDTATTPTTLTTPTVVTSTATETAGVPVSTQTPPNTPMNSPTATIRAATATLVPEPSPTPTPTVPTATPTVIIPDTALDTAFVQQQTASLNRVYTIARGDTLARIALRTGVDQEMLRRLNRLSEEETERLFIGQQLLLPAVGDDLRVRQPEREYVIQPGDNLGSIAAQFGLSLTDLLAANRLADPNNISVGQRLTIPRPTTVDSALAAQDALVGPVQNGFYYYTVQPGDTISQLAQAFNSTKLAIFEYNKDVLPDQETVFTGLEVRIPFGPPSLPNRQPPVPASGSSFMVSLSRQQCWFFHGDRVTHEWTCSTGYGEWITRVGTFAVQSKIENAESSAYQLDMPYWLGIYNVGPFENGIHGLPVAWDTGEKIWEGLIGEPATFGCAMLADDDAAVLFAASYIGMPVHIMN